jgi:hypothetical protein
MSDPPFATMNIRSKSCAKKVMVKRILKLIKIIGGFKKVGLRATPPGLKSNAKFLHGD